MAASTCPKCGGGAFENKLKQPAGYAYPLNLIQCTACGAVVGVMPEFDPGFLAKENQKDMQALKTKLEGLEQLLQALAARK